MEEEAEDIADDQTFETHPKINLTSSEKEQIKSAEKNIIAGGIAGSIGKTVTAPLSRLTVLYQVSPLLKQRASSSSTSTTTNINVEDSLLRSIRKIVRNEGFLSLWKGNFTTVIHRFPFSAANFATFEFFKSFYLSYDPTARDSTWLKMMCGAFAGGISSFLCYPLDLVRIRLTVGGGDHPSSPSSSSHNGQKTRAKLGSKIVDMMTRIIEKDGFFGLYHGLTASLLVAIPNYALSFTVYGQVKGYILKYYNSSWLVNQQSGNLSPLGSLVGGSMSGITSAVFLFPLDVIRKRMQVIGLTHNDSKLGPAPYRVGAKGLIDHARAIAKHDGWRGFYRGLSPEILKGCPMVAVTFCSYEITKGLLDDLFP